MKAAFLNDRQLRPDYDFGFNEIQVQKHTA